MPELTRLLAAEGVRRVIVTTPEPSAIAASPSIPSPRSATATSSATRCAELLPDPRGHRADPRRPLRGRGASAAPTRPPAREPASGSWINERVCEGCGDCGEKSSCLSVVPVETEFGRKTMIHQCSCNHDLSCLKGDCPSFVVVTPAGAGAGATGGRLRPTGDRRIAAGRPAAPEPSAPAPTTCWSGCPGIGGHRRRHRLADPPDGRPSRRPLRRRARPDRPGPEGRPGDLRRAHRRPTDQRPRSRPAPARSTSCSGSTCWARPATRTWPWPTRRARSPWSTWPRWPRRPWCATRPSPSPGTGRGSTGPPGRRRTCYLDAQWIAERLFDDHLPANLVMLGAAYQHGCLPVTADAVEEAIRLNGAGAAENRAAFRWGRAAVIDPAAVTAALAPPAAPEPEPPASLRRLLRLGARPPWPRGADATRRPTWPGTRASAYARRYLDRGARGGPDRGRADRRRRLAGDRRLRPGPAQAHGLQGRVRGGPAPPRRRPAGRPCRPSSAPEPPPRSCCTRRRSSALGLKRKIRLGPSGRPGLPGAAGRPPPAGHGARPLRPGRDAPDRAGTGRGVRRTWCTGRSSQLTPAPAGAGGRDRRAGRGDPGLRGREAAQHQRLPRPGRRAGGSARVERRWATGVTRGHRSGRQLTGDGSRAGHRFTPAGGRPGPAGPG